MFVYIIPDFVRWYLAGGVRDYCVPRARSWWAPLGRCFCPQICGAIRFAWWYATFHPPPEQCTSTEKITKLVWTPLPTEVVQTSTHESRVFTGSGTLEIGKLSHFNFINAVSSWPYCIVLGKHTLDLNNIFITLLILLEAPSYNPFPSSNHHYLCGSNSLFVWCSSFKRDYSWASN